MKSALLFTLLFSAVATQPVPTTINSLLTDRAHYDGMVVTVSGLLELHGEGDALCENESCTRSVAIDLGLPWKEEVTKYGGLYMKRVTISGVFNIAKDGCKTGETGNTIGLCHRPEQIVHVAELHEA